MIVVSRFDVTDEQEFLEQATAALGAFASRPGWLRGRVGRAADEPSAWVVVTEWSGVGDYRRSLGSYDVKVLAAPLLAQGRDEPSAFEVLVTGDEGPAAQSARAHDADTSGPGTP